ncbi:MAG: acetate--CoA ligase family protein [Casimicrobiaceae bacterium]
MISGILSANQVAMATADVQHATLDEVASKAWLARHGIAVPRSAVVADASAIDQAIANLCAPFALKVIAQGVSHKSDVGGVALRLADADALRAAMRSMRDATGLRDAAIRGFLIEEMAPRGHEMIIGGVNDRAFGPVVMLGMGGVFVEIFGDVAFRVCPIARSDAYDMLASLKAAPLLAGARGGVVAAIEPLIDTLMAIGGEHGLLVREAAWIDELDINPVIASDKAAVAVDARIVRRT